jgi:hypothetical protein
MPCWSAKATAPPVAAVLVPREKKGRIDPTAIPADASQHRVSGGLAERSANYELLMRPAFELKMSSVQRCAERRGLSAGWRLLS